MLCDMTATIPGWQLAIRFLLEVSSLVAIGFWAHRWGLAPAIGAPLVVAVLWGVFAVPDDPSRSGKAPVAVPGIVRLLLELAVFGGGAAALFARGQWIPFGVFAAAVIVHHAGTVPRLRWLVGR
jgi:hypothetical protein